MDIAKRLANDFSGPIIFNYVWWILSEAKKREITRLYFLARDGYTLLRIAKLFCNRFQLDIECRYLYCSRAALRLPTYFFIGDEAFDLLLQWGYYVTLKTVLLRAKLSEDERRTVYAECGFKDIDENRQLTKKEFAGYTKKLRACKILHQYIVAKSKVAYGDAVSYLRQEGLLDHNSIVAIVDSGWIGSIQRSLRQLLEFSGYTGQLVGFYFGMYEWPKSVADGEYLTWYFNAGGSTWDKAPFNNNLFESILSAPHGMTIGYQCSTAGYIPLFAENQTIKEQIWAYAQSEAIYCYCCNRIRQIEFCEFDCLAVHKDTAKRIKRYMFIPTREEVDYYSHFRFCDDVTEAYQSPLANREQRVALRGYFIPRRVLRKFAECYPTEHIADLFWPYGTTAYLTGIQRWWYRWNIVLWETMKYVSPRKKIYPQKMVPFDELKRLVDLHEIVSFDIFDTLLYRTVNKPTDVFQLMEPWVEEHFNISNFHIKRVEAEREARKFTKNEDVTLMDIYDRLKLDDKEKMKIMECEKKAEMYVLRQDVRMMNLMQYCVDRGKSVFIISDMYQSKEFLSEVLGREVSNDKIALYVSSEEGVTKTTGNLYRLVMRKEKIEKGKNWLHFGDDIRSDYFVPRKLGMHAIIYNNGRKYNHGIGTKS